LSSKHDRRPYADECLVRPGESVIEVVYDKFAKSIRYKIDDTDLGIAFENILMDKEDVGQDIFPCVQLYFRGAKVELLG